MFNKFAKSIRWIVLAGILYSLYVVMIKDDIEFNNQTDEATLVKMAKSSNKSRDVYMINKRLAGLFPNKKEYQASYLTSVKQQANKLIDAHEKMLFPVAIGNYRYVKNIEFAIDKDENFVMVFNLTDIFNEDVDKKTQKTLARMFKMTHSGMYQHFGFDEMRLVLVPTFDSLDEIKIIDLNRAEKEFSEFRADATPVPVSNSSN
ncbi:MAG: hypothetical protein KAH32_05495 [Chlamydiia bacterium]|nr:hypothetical protein [Chlamydiia bacterium]